MQYNLLFLKIHQTYIQYFNLIWYLYYFSNLPTTKGNNMESQKTEHNTIEKENNAEKIYKIIEELMNYKNLLSEYDLKNDYEKYANLKTKYEAKKDEFLENDKKYIIKTKD